MRRVLFPLSLSLAAIFILYGHAIAQSVPQFQLGFKLLAGQIPAIVGEPIESEHWGDNGDSLQQTSTGLMVWRKADNWTAFTNGSTTWINGPLGVQSRLNSQRFEWEKDTVAPPPPAPSAPASGLILYKADWSAGLAGWSAANGWNAVNSMLVNDGSAMGITEFAPYAPQGTANYAVEAEIQVVRMDQYKMFGIVVRDNYLAGVHSWSFANIRHPFVGSLAGDRMAEGTFDPASAWHTYRVEVNGNTLRILIDGAPMAEATDNRFLSAGQVGIWDNGVQLNVRGFKVVAL